MFKSLTVYQFLAIALPISQSTTSSSCQGKRIFILSEKIVNMEPHSNQEAKKKIDAGYVAYGGIMGFLFALFGLIPLCCIDNPEQKNSFTIGWAVGFVLSIILSIIFYFTVWRNGYY